MPDIMEKKTVSEVRQSLERYDGNDLDDIKALWKGAMARKFQKDLLKEWHVYDNDKLVDEIIFLLEKKITGAFKDSDLISDDEEYENKIAFAPMAEKQRYMDARRFAELKRLYGPRLTCTGEIVESLLKYGQVEDQETKVMVPFWKKEKTNKNPAAYGIAAMIPFTRNIVDPSDPKNSIPLQCFGLDEDNAAMVIYNGRIFSGSLNIERLFDKMYQRKENKSVLALISDLCEAKIQDTEKRKSSMLAAQQLAVQKYGNISVTGGSGYLDDAFDIAARNGTWKYMKEISCTSGRYKNEDNEKLQKRLARTVLNVAGIDSLWQKISKKPLRGDISIADAEREIRSCMTGLFTAIRASSPNNNEANDLLNRYSDLLNLREGYLIDKIIEMQGNGGGHDFSADMQRLIDIVKEVEKEKGLLEKISQHATEKAVARNAVSLTNPQEIPASPTAAILLESLGLNSTSRPEEVISAMKNAEEKLASYQKSPVFIEKDAEYQRRVQRLAQDVSRIASDPLLATIPGFVLAASEAVNYKGKSLSAELSDIANDMREANIDMKMNKVDFLSVVNDPVFGDKEKIDIRNWTKDTPAQKNHERHVLDGSRYSMETLDTAAGQMIFMKENMGDIPLAIAADGKIISEANKAGFTSELLYVAKDTFKGGVELRGETRIRTEERQQETERENQEMQVAPH